MAEIRPRDERPDAFVSNSSTSVRQNSGKNSAPARYRTPTADTFSRGHDFRMGKQTDVLRLVVFPIDEPSTKPPLKRISRKTLHLVVIFFFFLLLFLRPLNFRVDVLSSNSTLQISAVLSRFLRAYFETVAPPLL